MDEVLPGLWVGGVRAAMDADYLSRAGVTHIISCMKQQIPVPPPLSDGRTITRAEMKHVRIDDDEKAPILVHFAGCNELIASQLQEEWVADDESEASSEQEEDEVTQLVQGRQKRDGRWGSWQTTGAGTVLVHCQAGCSRSVAIVAAYLMHTRRISATTAVNMIKQRRAGAGPNRGFMAQLELYEQVGFEVDMKWQAVRRFLMSKTDILNGDSMDDMLLSYYPSPYPSPGLSAGGMKGFTSIRPKTEDGDGEASTSADNFGVKNSRTTSKPLSRSASSCSTSSSSSHAGPRISQLSSIAATPSPSEPQLVESLSNMSTSSPNGESSTASTSTEVKVTANSSGRLPGGVQHVRGHEGVANRGQLSRPNFTGPKLRCKGCRRELAALDHVVIHEPGRGQMAFEHRKRDVGHQGQNVASNSSSSEGATGQDGQGLQTAADGGGGQASQGWGSTEAATASTSSATPAPANGKPKIQSAASLASQLPPHLAALRGARPRPPPSASSTTSSAPSNPSLSSTALPTSPSTNTPSPTPPPTASNLSMSMLKHPSCSSYFIEPMAWMSDLASGEVTGRLNCPTAKCGQKLGSWDWAGMQCACGAWVTPAFSLHRSKVDEI